MKFAYIVLFVAIAAADFDRSSYETYIDRAAPGGNFTGCTRGDGAEGLNAGNCQDRESTCPSGTTCYCCWVYNLEDPSGDATIAIITAGTDKKGRYNNNGYHCVTKTNLDSYKADTNKWKAEGNKITRTAADFTASKTECEANPSDCTGTARIPAMIT